MRLDAPQALALAERVVGMVAADDAEVVINSADSALTRFAGNRIHQNVADVDTQLQVRAVLGKRTGVASTNKLDAESLRRCAEAAVVAAQHSPEDPDFPGLPEPVEAPPAGARPYHEALAYDADARAHAAAEIIGQSRSRGLTAAGAVSRAIYSLAVANSRGVRRGEESADVRATVLSMNDSGGSGWASWLGRDASALVPATLGSRAAETAARAVSPGTLEPGTYTVVLAPEAVSDLLDFMGYVGFGAKAFAEGSSFLAGHVGSQLVDPRITIADDALSSDTIGFSFDFEGQPKMRTPLVEAGVARGPVTDSHFAAKLGMHNSGNALPAPNPYGPMPLNLQMSAGTGTEAGMIGAVSRGVYVTRFHYVNVEDPMKMVLTGMTRDGTFLIEDGRITRPLKNLRFTQGVLEALSHVGEIGAERVLIGPGEGGSTLVPALLLERWAFTGQTG